MSQISILIFNLHINFHAKRFSSNNFTAEFQFNFFDDIGFFEAIFLKPLLIDNADPDYFYRSSLKNESSKRKKKKRRESNQVSSENKNTNKTIDLSIGCLRWKIVCTLIEILG